MCLLLADGMGGGEAARKESALTCRLVEQFLEAGMSCETRVEGRRRSYVLTQKGRLMLQREGERLERQLEDYRRIFEEGEDRS